MSTSGEHCEQIMLDHMVHYAQLSVVVTTIAPWLQFHVTNTINLLCFVLDCAPTMMIATWWSWIPTPSNMTFESLFGFPLATL